MPPKKKIPPKSGGNSKGRVKKNKQPTQVNPKGRRVKVLGANGKFRWEWQ